MGEEDRVRRLDRAIDALLDGQGQAGGLDEEDSELLSVASDLAEFMSPVQAPSAFKESLRRELVTPRRASPAADTVRAGVRKPSLWERIGSSLNRPAFAFASLATVLLILAGSFYAFQALNNPVTPAGDVAGLLASPPAAETSAPAGTEEQVVAAAVPATTEPAGPSEPTIAPIPTVTPLPAVAATPAPSPTPEPVLQVAAYGPLPRLTPMPVGLGCGPGPCVESSASPAPDQSVLVDRVEMQETPSLPAQAPVYQIEEPDLSADQTREAALRLGAAFGFSTAPTEQSIPKEEGGDPAVPERTTYTWQEGDLSLQYDPISNHISYQDLSQKLGSQDGTPPVAKRPAKNDQEAISAAMEFVTSKGLLSEEYQVTAESDPGSQFWSVEFQRSIGGSRIVGSWVRVTIGDELKVTSLEAQVRPIAGSSPYPLKTLDEALGDLKVGKALLWEPPDMFLPGRHYDVLRVSKVAIAYQEDNPGRLQGYLQPLYAFQGTVTYQGDVHEVTVYVPAVSPDYLAP